MIHALDDRTFVAGQIAAEDVAEIARMGVARIVNNRPDGEEAGQPTGVEIEAAARACGLDYRHIPVAGGFSFGQIEAMAAALDDTGGAILAFCRSGTRSAFLWALAESLRGRDGAELIERAAAAGYDLSPIHPHLG